jgi:PhzF family phenazine biosynthesis protein
MGQSIIQVDAFASEPFSGNPAAVCVLTEDRSDRWMQDVAREMNLSETAFLRPGADGFSLRWFTPTVEVALCGHATLASAHVLWETGRLASSETARFHTLSGLLTAVRRGDWIELDFPATPEQPAEPAPGLLDALGVTPRYVGKTRFDYLIELDDEQAVKRVQPDFGRFGKIGVRGVMVTSLSATSNRDFVSRFFAPGSGVNEDPVTGSAHCCLAPFWGRRLKKDKMIAHQISARGGILRVELAGDRVRLAGQAVTVSRGELTV